MKTNVYKIIVDSVLAKYKTATEFDRKSVAGQKLRNAPRIREMEYLNSGF